MSPLVSFTVPIHTPSLSNLREHWSARAKRARLHRLATMAAWANATMREREDRAAAKKLAARIRAGEPLTITLTRISPRKIDSSNCGAALKSVVDQVAEELGINDGDERHTWSFRQRKGEPGVLVEIA
jgi:soluble lytic murein transglycosylase-like protein